MRFRDVHIASVAARLPDEIVTSAALEERLAPLYARLGLSPGRLELFTGIRERRFFAPGTPPSAPASEAGRRALTESGIAPEAIGCLVFAGVCRDFVEPSTASVVHDALGLDPRCEAFDLSNACLGFLNAMALVASRIERGEIAAALVVTGEDGRPLVEETLRVLLADESVGRVELKRAFASLTIGSGAAAAVLAHRSLLDGERARRAPRLVGGLALADTAAHALCRGDTAPGGGYLMETDSEGLLEAGTRLAARTFALFLEELGWERGSIARAITHQVGSEHRRRLLEALELDLGSDFPTVDLLGNTGSAALPIAHALAREEGLVGATGRVAWLGIGSGLHCLMLGLESE